MNRKKTGTINMYNDKFDYVSPKQAIPVKVDENIGLYNWVATIENTLIDIIQEKPELNVFASDAVIATLMTSPLSVYPWDVSVEKRSGKIFLEYNEKRIFEYTTTCESATIPPEEDLKKKEGSVNGPKKLSWEATMSNHYFSQQVLQPKTELTLGPDPGFKLPEKKEKPKKGYIYKMWTLDKEKNLKLCVRCQVDGYIKVAKAEEKPAEEGAKDSKKKEEKKPEEDKKEPSKPEDKFTNELLNIKALNEYYGGKNVRFPSRYHTE